MLHGNIYPEAKVPKGPIVRRVIEEAGASGIDVLIIGRHEAPE